MRSKADSKKSASVPDDMEIAPGHTVADWKVLKLGDAASSDWQQAIAIFECRVRKRFIEPTDVLIAQDAARNKERGTFGFAILALDCMVIETLQGFREGLVDHRKRSAALVSAFLEERDAFKQYFPNVIRGGAFYRKYRCALLHTAQTDGDFRVGRSGPLIERQERGRVAVNRTDFHKALTTELDSYLGALRSGASGLRSNFRKKMNAICGIHTDQETGATP